MTDELETMACEEQPSDQMGMGGGGGAWGRWSTVLIFSTVQEARAESKIVGALVALHHRHRCMCEGCQLSG